jgi:hypothetical protein
MKRFDFKVGDLVVYKRSIKNFFMTPRHEGKIGVAVEIINEDIYGEAKEKEAMFITVARVLWSDGRKTREPIILLEKYKNV